MRAFPTCSTLLLACLAVGMGRPSAFADESAGGAAGPATHNWTGLYVGARNGAVWASADAGETWRQIVADLPDVMVVRAASL